MSVVRFHSYKSAKESCPLWPYRLINVGLYALLYWLGARIAIDTFMVLLLGGLLYWGLVHQHRYKYPYFFRFHALQALLMTAFFDVGTQFFGAILGFLQALLKFIPTIELSNEVSASLFVGISLLWLALVSLCAIGTLLNKSFSLPLIGKLTSDMVG